jgi:hypothetical protein
VRSGNEGGRGSLYEKKRLATEREKLMVMLWEEEKSQVIIGNLVIISMGYLNFF